MEKRYLCLDTRACMKSIPLLTGSPAAFPGKSTARRALSVASARWNTSTIALYNK